MDFGIAIAPINALDVSHNKNIVFVHCHCKEYSEFHVDSTIE